MRSRIMTGVEGFALAILKGDLTREAFIRASVVISPRLGDNFAGLIKDYALGLRIKSVSNVPNLL